MVVLAVVRVARAAMIAETYLVEAKAGMVAVVPTAVLEKPAVRPLRGSGSSQSAPLSSSFRPRHCCTVGTCSAGGRARRSSGSRRPGTSTSPARGCRSTPRRTPGTARAAGRAGTWTRRRSRCTPSGAGRGRRRRRRTRTAGIGRCGTRGRRRRARRIWNEGGPGENRPRTYRLCPMAGQMLQRRRSL